MGKPREYTVRTFEPAREGSFDCTGLMAKLATYKEETLPKQFAAVPMLTRGEHTADSARALSAGALPLFQLNDQDAQSATSNMLGVEVAVFTISTNLVGQDEVRDHGTAVRELIRTWAEKSRVKGVRGFRAHAIKTPVFEMNKSQGAYDLKFEVILSTAVFYNQIQATIVSSNNFIADSALFKKKLEKEIGSVVISFEHSALGIGAL